jgi:hypothetical protein
MDRIRSRPSESQSWRGRRPLAALAIAFGVYTFFMPLISLKTPALGRAEWSAFNMALEVRNGRLPADRRWIELPVVEDALMYLLMMTACVMLLLPRGRNVLSRQHGRIISALATRNATRHFVEFVTGSSNLYWNGGATFGPAIYLLPLTMLALFLVSRISRVTDEP